MGNDSSKIVKEKCNNEINQYTEHQRMIMYKFSNSPFILVNREKTSFSIIIPFYTRNYSCDTIVLNSDLHMNFDYVVLKKYDDGIMTEKTIDEKIQIMEEALQFIEDKVKNKLKILFEN